MLHSCLGTSCGRRWTGVWNSWNLAWRHRNPLQSRVSIPVNKRSSLWEGLAGVLEQRATEVLNCALFLLWVLQSTRLSVQSRHCAVTRLHWWRSVNSWEPCLETTGRRWRRSCAKSWRSWNQVRRTLHGWGKRRWKCFAFHIALQSGTLLYEMSKHLSLLFAPLLELWNLPELWKWRETSARRKASSSGSAQKLAGKAKIQQDAFQSHPGHLTHTHSNSNLPKKSFALISCRKV